MSVTQTNINRLPRMAHHIGDGPTQDHQVEETARKTLNHDLLQAQHSTSSLTVSGSEKPTRKRKRVPDDEPKPRRSKKYKNEGKGVDGKPKGQVRAFPTAKGNRLQWFDPETGEWEFAVYHHRIRMRLILRANQNGALKYDHPRECTDQPGDETSYVDYQKTWSPHRDHWSRIPHDILNKLDQKDWNCDHYGTSDPEIWREKDFVGKVPHIMLFVSSD